MLLALAMVFALAIPAFAADDGDGDIVPYGQVVPCPRCQGSATAEHISKKETLSVSSCTKFGYPHTHTMTTTYTAYNCSSCGYWETAKNYTTTCP